MGIHATVLPHTLNRTTLHRSTRNPVKLALSFPRSSTVEQVLLKAVAVYNNFELHCLSGGDGSISQVNDTCYYLLWLIYYAVFESHNLH